MRATGGWMQEVGPQITRPLGERGQLSLLQTRAGRGELERLPELPLAVLLRDQLQQRRVASGLPDPCAGAPS